MLIGSTAYRGSTMCLLLLLLFFIYYYYISTGTFPIEMDPVKEWDLGEHEGMVGLMWACRWRNEWSMEEKYEWECKRRDKEKGSRVMYIYDLIVYHCGASLLSLKNKQKVIKKEISLSPCLHTKSHKSRLLNRNNENLQVYCVTCCIKPFLLLAFRTLTQLIQKY